MRVTSKRRSTRDGWDTQPVAEVGVQLRDQPIGSGSVCRTILGTLPTWFGVSRIRRGLRGRGRTVPSVIASLDGEDIGFLTLVHHSPYASEVYVIAILPDHHRRGIGRKVLKHVEGSLARAGVEFLQVKTLSDKHPDEGDEKTRALYLAYGFRPLEEFPELWSPESPALQLVKAVAER
jgi:ribosomal protein S18 acetylase RimI-like enzyme